MEEHIFERYKCWKDERISQVINKEAVSVERANFLATHMPLNAISYARAPQHITDTGEQGLLDELLGRSIAQKHTFAVVQGIPGTGKSHLIRWLKELYYAANKEHGNSDIVLLIERAQCNLRGTLMQIIDSGAFEATAMHTQLEKLRGATIELSKNALNDTILDQLRIATGEVSLPPEQLPGTFVRKRLELFFLDAKVRLELKKPGGPIDRITRYLSVEGTTGIEDNEIPGFIANDFKFSIDTLRTIRNEGYKDAQDLAERLQEPEQLDLRNGLAMYLNRLLPYAIGRATALSADDLKQIFNDLRRHLRQQNRQLALFIEDITAFTGLDVGLIDVLATQHTGESNREFCRLLSVIGITDYYFDAHFPDNMKERVTHLLKLDTEQPGQKESELLASSHDTANMAARYLNAMRLEQSTLENWSRHSADPEQLPIACDTCQFYMQCHQAFGSIEISSDVSISRRIGLYPFNQQALWTMYQGISSSRTPRSLLNSVLEYVLESHSSKIVQGVFPPIARELGSDFKAPSLAKIPHRNIIEEQGKKDARRIESLVLFWGNRTVDTTDSNQGRLVGGLPRGVFKAFNLPFIEGEVQGTQFSQSRTATSSLLIREDTSSSQTYAQTSIVNPVENTPPQTINIPSAQVTADQTQYSTIDSEQQRYKDDINNWLNGEKLQNYEKLGRLLVTLISTFIDWDIYGISSTQVEDRVKPRRIIIEGQAGKYNPNDCLILKCTNKFASALLALVDISENNVRLSPAALGGHMTFLSNWLYEHEQLIVEFVRRPSGQSTETMPLSYLLLVNCLLLTCLQGKLEYKTYSSRELLLLIVKYYVQVDTSDWRRSIDEAQKIHALAWVNLMKGMEKRGINVRSCYQSLLQALNKAQGSSQDVRFIDAALALDIIEDFERKKWVLIPVESNGTIASPVWSIAYDVYGTLLKYFDTAISEDRNRIEKFVREFEELIGVSDPKEVFQAINQWIEQMKRSQRAYRLEPKSSVNASRLSRVRSTFDAVLKEQNHQRLILRLSAIGPAILDAQEHLQYLQDFSKEVTGQIAQSEQSLDKLRTQVNSASLPATVVQYYDDVINILAEVSETMKEEAK